MMGTAWTYAFRSLRRNARRTVLSVVGIGVGCALALFMESLNRGRDELFARMGAYAGAGHVRIVPAGWRERRDPRLRLANWQADVDGVARSPGVTAMTVSAQGAGAARDGYARGPCGDRRCRPAHRAQHLPFRANHCAWALSAANGHWRRRHWTGHRGSARRLKWTTRSWRRRSAQTGDIESMLLRIVGIVRTGSDEIDATICQVVLADVDRLTGLTGIGEVTLILDDWERVDAVKAALSEVVGGGDEVLTWGEISPEFKGHLEQDSAVSRLVSGIILLIVMLGVASAQLAAVLERRREFAVLSALGMHSRTIVAVLLQEALAIGLASAALGLALGLPFVWRLAKSGIDLSRYMGTTYSFQGVIIEPVIYGDIGSWTAWYVFTVAVVVTVLASLYPAWFAARTDPADALRVA